MKKKYKVLILIFSLCLIGTIANTYAWFKNDKSLKSVLSVKTDIDVNLDANYGFFESNAKITVTDGIVDLPIPKQDKHFFIGFAEKGNFNNQYTCDQQECNSIQAPIDEINHKTFVAIWTYPEYSISYDLGLGNYDPNDYYFDESEWWEYADTDDLPTLFYLTTETKDLTIVPLKRNGYDFLGWTGPGIDEPTVNPTIKFSKLKELSQDLHYTAHWSETRNYYTINFDIYDKALTGELFDMVPGFIMGTTRSFPVKYVTDPALSPARNQVFSYRYSIYPSSFQYSNYLVFPSATNKIENKTVLYWKDKRTNQTYSPGSKQLITSMPDYGYDMYFEAVWGDFPTYTVDVNPIIHTVSYPSGLDSFTFSVWINNILVAENVTDYYNDKVSQGSKVKVHVNDREGYSLTSFREDTWTVTSDLIINPSWYDNIPPTIVDFYVENLGYNDPRNISKGWNIHVYINGWDKGTGLQKYQTWLVPYKEGSGAGRKDGGDRIMTNVIRLRDPEGRTFCAYAIDWAGNESSKCATIKV